MGPNIGVSIIIGTRDCKPVNRLAVNQLTGLFGLFFVNRTLRDFLFAGIGHFMLISNFQVQIQNLAESQNAG